MKRFLRILLSLFGIALAGGLVIAVINRYVHSQTGVKIQKSMTEVPAEEPPRVAIVFGARLG